MHPENENIINLLEKFAIRKASSEELDRLFDLIKENGGDETLVSFITSHLEENEPVTEQEMDFWKNQFEGFNKRILEYSGLTSVDLPGSQQEIEIPVAPAHRIHFLRSAWFRYAVAIILLFGVGAYFYFTPGSESIVTTVQQVPVSNDVAPGSNKAVLTLSDGSKVELNAQTTNIQDASAIIENTQGKLQYQQTQRAVWNTMTTPRGGQYQLSLPDGTNVWLNAASSITYPTAFAGQERKVTVTGEVYFEVAKNARQPFIVQTRSDVITVLGTHFNVHAYADEPAVVTTLLEGRVSVDNNGSSRVLQPGQATMNGQVAKADVSQVVAWKNGLFDFNHKPLSQVLKELSRWYDIDINYEGKVPGITYWGKMQRDLNLSDVLDFLKGSGVQFRMGPDRQLIVQSK